MQPEPDAVRALIAEAEELAKVTHHGDVNLVIRLADALEALLPREDADLDARTAEAAGEAARLKRLELFTHIQEES